MSWQPTPNYRYATKEGMSGVEVWALQINLTEIGYPLAFDGIFGPATDAAVKRFQQDQGLVVDGIAGVMTQRGIILKAATPASSKYTLPMGLLKSIASNESGFVLAAYSPHPSDGGFDFGPYQLAFPPAEMNETIYQSACDSRVMAIHVGSDARQFKNQFRQAPKVDSDKYAWQLAVLYHNWPFAAHNLANIGSIYPNAAMDDVPQAWIVSASGGRLATPRQWVDHYIAASTVFVTSWPA